MKRLKYALYGIFLMNELITLHAEVHIEKGLSYNDVLLIPQQTDLISRNEVCTKTRLTKNITLNIPIISSNMDSVTESDMAIAMALHGGIGIIHRFNTIEEQVAEVKRVKRYCDDNNKLVGIITSRDTNLIPADNRLVSEIMTKKENLINDRLVVGAAIGVQDDALERAEALVQAGVDVLVIDVAHGHSASVLEMIHIIKNTFPLVDLIAGNVATAQGTRALIEAGADCIKVGVGPGSICTTRIATGCGYPQLSAIIQCAQEANRFNIPIIADGGIACSGDITKAIAAGASTVMLGNLLAGTDESPGRPFYKNGKKYKVIRGMASFGANLSRNKKLPNDYVEGVEAFQLYKGSVKDIIQQLLYGLRSGMSYCGVRTIEALRSNGYFVEITSQGIRESHPHDVQEVIS